MRMTLFITLLSALILFDTCVHTSFSCADSDSRGVKVTKKSGDGRRRIALVIGNSSYEASPLKNPANDAHVIAATLRRLGFEVDEKINLGYIPMHEAVENFGSKLSKGEVGLFYYAGHGMQVNGANYLIPVDARINDENEVRYKAVDVGQVLAKMEQANSEVNIVILDACRDNPFARSFRSGSRGLASMDAPSGTFIAYATAPGKTAADGGNGQNGLYTSELTRVLEQPGLKLEDLFKQTLKAVREKSRGKQSPWVASNLEKDFWFIPPTHTTDVQISQDEEEPAGNSSEKMSSEPSASRGTVSGMEFIHVPGGCFHMGDFRGDNKPIYLIGSDEHPVHKVCVNEFRIGKYPVTQKQWRTVMGNNPSDFSGCGDNCPVENVSWNDVREFIEKLNRKAGKDFRLPTEAEWEYACRSGGNNEKFCGGNEVDSLAWYEKNCGDSSAAAATWYARAVEWYGKKRGGSIQPVGQKEPNGLGIYDMSGNVWEWVQDWYDKKYYKASPSDNPPGPLSGKTRACRGGSWSDGAKDLRASFRGSKSPDYRSNNLGFRLTAPGQ